MRPLFLIKLSLSDTKARLTRRFLLLLGIAIGVAVVVAVDLANNSVSRSFQLSTAAISGRATHQIVGATGDLPQEIYPELRKQTRKIAPVISGYVKIEGLGDKMFRLLGVDPFVDQLFRGYFGNISASLDQDLLYSLLTQPGSVLIAESLARENNLKPGDPINLKTRQGVKTATITGLSRSDNDFTNQALTGLILCDISVAQEILSLNDRITSIDLIIGPDESGLLSQIEKNLPITARLIKLEQVSEATRRMSSSFELNLRALSLLALFVGMFLIYNTVTFSVVQRRFQLGTLRALGMTRKEIFGLILTETAIWGALGTVLGLLLGIVLGTGMIRLVSQTISDLYFVLTVNTFHLAALTIIKAVALGLVASLVSAAIPAFEASTVKPAEALRRSSIEKRASRQSLYLSIGGIILISISLLSILIPSQNLTLGFVSLFIFVSGAAMVVPWVTARFTEALGIILSPIASITTRMAVRGISRSLSRTGVSIASLMVAISVIIGVETMVGSFRTTVVEWLSQTIRADIYVRPTHTMETLPFHLSSNIQSIPGIARVYTIQRKTIPYGEYANSELVAINEDVSDRDWLWTADEETAMPRLFEAGWVFISETFAWKHQLSGEENLAISLDTERGPYDFKVAGIFRDFTSDKGIVVMRDSTFHQYWQDRSLFGISLDVSEGISVDHVIKNIEDRFGGEQDLAVGSNQSLRNTAIAIFDRTFTITIAIRILAALVAFLGVLNTIMSLTLEREREIGVLRANGLTVPQLWKMALTESSIMGLAAGLFALPLGTSLAWILVVIINKRSFGWTLEFILQPQAYPKALLLAVSAAALAAVYPVLTITRKPLARILRSE